MTIRGFLFFPPKSLILLYHLTLKFGSPKPRLRTHHGRGSYSE